MELDLIQDAFDRVSKKQKLSSSKTQELVRQIEHEIEQAITKMQSTENATSCPELKQILADLKNKLNEFSPMNQLETLQKDLNITLGKYVKVTEKSFNPDISKAYRNVDFDPHIVNQIIASHFYRQGLFDLGDCFISEANEPEAAALKTPFLEMYGILESMRRRNLELALNWASSHSEWLAQNGSNLELKLHQLQFVEILQNDSVQNALSYVRKHLAPNASAHKVEIPKLMGCLVWSGKLHKSPYADLLSPNHWEKLADEFMQQFCSCLGQSYQSPLSIAIAAGIHGLPTLLKLESVMAVKKQEWQAMKQLPVPIDLSKDFQFHSIFVCPVLREQGSDENPPMLMPCGHVLSKQSIVKLSKSSTRPFKCPYCPLEASVAQCRQLHF
ncbi:protein RMD5 homolog [Zingiber officinale]|uniref:protein RMD5 homolog n=1 Tax=Zingiber officinale TaxID=94328 RepID=UPI001C4C779A|nr:protein RMD5 homolog [Zingiber officinale]